MPPDVQPEIEPATQAELETIADWWVRLAREQREHGSHVLPEPNRETIVDVLGAHRIAGGLLVAKLDDEPVGFASFTMERGSFELDVTRGFLSNLYVTHAYRNRGVGTALLEAVESELASRGAEVLALEAMANNEAARRFYRRNGYEPYRVAMERRLAGEHENDTHTREHE